MGHPSKNYLYSVWRRLHHQSDEQLAMFGMFTATCPDAVAFKIRNAHTGVALQYAGSVRKHGKRINIYTADGFTYHIVADGKRFLCQVCKQVLPRIRNWQPVPLMMVIPAPSVSPIYYTTETVHWCQACYSQRMFGAKECE